MPEIDGTYTFTALPPEERARIATQRLEEMERNFFTAQVDLALRKAQLDTTDTEAVAAFDAEKKQTMGEHKKRLKVAKAIFEEVKIKPTPTPPAPAPGPSA